MNADEYRVAVTSLLSTIQFASKQMSNVELNRRLNDLLSLRLCCPAGVKPVSRNEIGKRWLVTGERVRQTESRFLRQCRHPSRRAVVCDLARAFPSFCWQVYGYDEPPYPERP